jgi:glutathione-regulated potassium-efflux system ancillary protein KefF
MSDASNSGAGVVVIYAHPYPDRSRANRVLFDAVRALPGVQTRAIYDLYPDFDIDVEAEQAALAAAHTVVWQHPIYWYTAPALMKLWFERVLAHGWAYGAGGEALVGKRCLWVTTTGADEAGYTEGGMHKLPFPSFEPVIAQTARFCGMQWLEPLVVHGAHRIDDEALFRQAGVYRDRITTLFGGS